MIPRLLIAVPVWVITVLILGAYWETADDIVDYMKEFHGPAWARLNRRFIFYRGWPVNLYYRPRKAVALNEIIWWWPRPLRHRELDGMIGKAKALGIVGLVFFAASVLAVAFVFPDRP